MVAAVAQFELPLMKDLRRIGEVMRSGETGPLRVAHDALRVAAEWEKTRDPKGGLSASAAFKRHLQKDVAYFTRAASAVDVMGRDICNWMAHDLAIWVMNATRDDARRRDVAKRLADAFAERRKFGGAVTLSVAKPVLRALLGKTGRPAKACAECARLREELRLMRIGCNE